MYTSICATTHTKVIETVLCSAQFTCEKNIFLWSVVVGRIVVGTRPPLRDGRRTTWYSNAKGGKGTVAYDHTTLKAPVLVRSPQLSSVGPAQYLDG